jgi:Ca2+:H+ antiporter
MAGAEARGANQATTGPEHLLLALLREKRGVAYQALIDSGADLDQARATLGRKRPASSVPRPEPRREDAPPRPTPVMAAPAMRPRPEPPSGPATRPGASWLSLRNVLLLAAPLSWLLARQGAGSILIFVVACVAVLPLAGYMGQATEHLAHRTGPTVGGLLNATFGNAAELIIAIVALQAGLITLVKASITGSILGNLLLIQGLSLFAGGLRRPSLKFSRSAAGMSAGMLALAVVSLVFPALFHSIHPEAGARVAERTMSEAVAVVLGITYFCSLLFSMKTHRDLFSVESHPMEGPVWGTGKALLVLAAATAGVAAESELLVHATEAVTATLGLSETFLGLIVIPIIGNAAEHASAIMVARKGQIDLALQIALGSSTQVALLVAPVLVFVGVLMGQGMDLVFTPFEVVSVGLATIVTAILTLDGESHWYEGIQLLAVYAIIVVAGYFI